MIKRHQVRCLFLYPCIMRKIVITSGKGGVGKTTVTAALGRKLADMDYSVVLVDGDVGLNNLDVVVGIESRVVYDVADALAGKCRVSQALVDDRESRLKVLPSSKNTSLVTVQAFRGLLNSLTADFVLIDCPAGIEEGFHRAVSAADEALVVTTPSASAIRDADKVIALLSSYRLSDVGLIVNRVRTDMVARGEMLGASDIGRLLHLPPVGVIPEDDCITLYQQLGRMPDFALSDRAMRFLALNVANGTKELREPMPKRRLRIWR